jgi:DNA-binding XRE family transcriptional regulator
MISITPGLKLKLKRIERGLTQDGLAEKAGVSKITIVRYEKNERDPRISTVKKLCEVLELDVRELLF